MQPQSTARDIERTALALARVSGVGPVTFRTLVETFGSAEAVFRAAAGGLRAVEGCSRRVVDAILAFDAWGAVDEELDRLTALGGRLLPLWHPDYPMHLRRIHDPPPVLYALGQSPGDERRVVAVVGSRRATPYGRATASRLAAELVRAGFVVASGMARGIDAAAHEGALAAGGRTVGVLGCGVDVSYPPEMRALKETVRCRGAILSELPLGAPPDPGHFPTRNRIISGMSLGVLVIEATADSGSLITARLALDQGREVFAVPGNVGSPTSIGTNRLIKAGATLVESADDLIETLVGQIGDAVRPAEGSPAVPIDLTPDERRVCELLSWEPLHVDELTTRLSVPPARLAEVLLGLELKGVARQVPGHRYVRHPAGP